MCDDVFKDLESFGSRVASEISVLGREAETHPPELRQYDGWGRRVDELVTSEAWRRLHDVSAEEGLVAIGYERKHSQWRSVCYYYSLHVKMDNDLYFHIYMYILHI